MTYDDDTSWAYGYDSRGQVASGSRLDAQSQPIAGQQYSYLYDLIGNRTSAELGSGNNSVSYTANLLNQYTLVNAAVPTYDADGNMLTYDGWNRTYDAENRLICEENGSDKYEYVYDYRSRRIEVKHSERGVLTLYEWSLQSTTRYVWDDWNIIAEFDADNNVFTWSKSYLWGLDVTGSLNAAGGVGALLAETNATGTYFACHDGAGNVNAYLSDTGAVVAEYRYDPFLGVTATVGSTADFAYQAGTKRYNPVTGSLSYQLRDYSPLLGRWLTRDPIEEKGGVNLYVMCVNDPVNNIDLRGGVKLNIKIMGELAWRIGKIGTFGLIGAVHNWISFNDPINLFDDEQELYPIVIVPAHELLREQLLQKNITRKWKRFELSETNIAARQAEKILLFYDSTKFSSGWWLNAASDVRVKGFYYARCTGDQILYYSPEMTYAWHDIIDANSFHEAASKGAFSKFGWGYVSNILESLWDTIGEKVLATDYKIIVNGKFKIDEMSLSL